MLITRYTKIVMVASLAIFCLLVVFGNLTDYNTNLLFVQHVLSMDTTFPGNKLMYRAITSPELWHFAYWLIIAGQAVAGVLFLAGAIRLWQVRAAPGADFDRAKGLTIAGALAAFLVWFGKFMIIGGEWFAMWQSSTWNGQSAAFWFYATALLVVIFVNQPDIDLPGRTPSGAPAKKRAVAKKKALAKKRAQPKKSA